MENSPKHTASIAELSDHPEEDSHMVHTIFQWGHMAIAGITPLKFGS